MMEVEESRNRAIRWLREELGSADPERLAFLMDRYEIRRVGREEAMMLDYSDDTSIKFRDWRLESCWFVVGGDKIDKIVMLDEVPSDA